MHPNERYLLIRLSTRQVYEIAAQRGRADIWQIELMHHQAPIAQAVFRISDNPLIAWMLDQVQSHGQQPVPEVPPVRG